MSDDFTSENPGDPNEDLLERFYLAEEEFEAKQSRWGAVELSWLKRERAAARQDYAARGKGSREAVRESRESKEYELSEIVELESMLAQTHEPLIGPSRPPVDLVDAVIEFNSHLMEHILKRPGEMYSLRPRQFEQLMAEILASFGWRIELSPTTRDGGYDIYALSKDRSGLEVPWLVECKRYRSDRPVGIEIVRSFWAVKTDLRIPNGLIATTSRFTSGAKQFKSSRYDLKFRDFQDIVEWLNRYRQRSNSRLYLEDHRLKIGHLP